MPSADILPSAPPEDSHLYPQISAHDYRMQKANEVAALLDGEAGHYRVVAKKYKRAKKIVHFFAVGCGGLSAVLSLAGLGSAISVVGLPASLPLGGVGAAFAFASSVLIAAGKKLDSKIKKHHEVVTLAVAKRDTVFRLHSKALADNRISDAEFQMIMAEFSQYNSLKEAVRAKQIKSTPQQDIDKIKKDVRKELEEEQRKKIAALLGVSN